ncbi:tripartite motif-containing protein 16-like isoform X2 [Xyrauchen texanus]|uniref:tripartite motif-containing protein 16-like isoform X2 n=1 Tax=Xyrauchen texanus TaxID=154827 RepID=UPI0022421FB5|nr:tripartite motif-containing protein 16-like isoform X2 [Xyrauchen texanus]
MDEHKNHDTGTAATETDKQKQLEKTQKEFKKIIQQRVKEVQELRKTVESHKRSAQTAVEDSERIFSELMRSIERRRSEVTQLIRDQEKAAVSRAEGLLERLVQEIADLRRRDAELDQISHTHDHIHFLESFQSLSVPLSESTDIPSISSRLSFDDVGKSVSLLRGKLEDFCKEEIEKLSGRDSQQYTLDPNTVYKRLRLSEENRVATHTGTNQQYPDHPERFDSWLQVLCRESVCGRCYWEVELSGSDVRISVSYKSISRKGWDVMCGFGYNDQSWSLFCSPSRYTFWHNNKRTELPVVLRSYRIGVYVDHSAGTLSFYSVSDTMTLIHRVQTTFTQPLYPGFAVCKESTVKLCKI